MKSIASLLILSAPMVAFAGKVPQKPADPSVESTAVGVGVGVAEGGDAVAVGVGGKATSGAKAASASDSASVSAAGAQSGGNSMSTSFASRDKFLSLAFSGAHPDPGSTAPCLESRPGWGFGFRSGRTKMHERCYFDLVSDRQDRREFEQCMTIVATYIEAGAMQAAMSQLTACGGRAQTIAASEIRISTSNEERLERVFEAAQQK